MSALFGDLPVLYDQDMVRLVGERHAVRYDESRPALHQFSEGVPDQVLDARVDGGRRLVEDEDRCVLQERPGD